MTKKSSYKNSDKSNANQQKYRDKLAKLAADYQEKLPSKLSQIEQLWQKLSFVNWNDEAFIILHHLAHALSGSGKTFGFSELSDKARELDIYLLARVNAGEVPNEQQRDKISLLIDNLLAVGEIQDVVPERAVSAESEDSAQLKSTQSLNRQQKKILVVDDDVQSAQYLQFQLQSEGYQVTVFHQISRLYQQVEQEMPDLVIMDIMFPEGSLAGIDAVEQIRAATANRTPILFLSARTDVTARLRAVRAGGDGYFTKPVSLSPLVQKIDELCLLNPLESYRVLIVEDEVELAQHYALVLQNSGMQVKTLQNPLHTIQILESFKPDLLIMDLNMPNIHGLELAKVISHDERFITLPILFISAESDPARQAEAKNFGASEYLMKPVVDEHLLNSAVKNITKARRISNKVSKVSRKNSQSGLMNRPSYLAVLEKAIATTTRSSQAQALLYLTIDHYDFVRTQVGIAELEPLSKSINLCIQQHLTADSCASQLAEAVFCILVTDKKTILIEQFAASLVDAIGVTPFSCGGQTVQLTVSAGLVFLSNEIKNIRSLLADADKAANKAVEAGGNQVYGVPLSQIEETPLGASINDTDDRLNQRIAKAVEEESFHLVFQPILNIEDKHQELYEVQLRLVDQLERIILPTQFYPVASKNNWLYELDRWTIQRSIELISENSHIRTKGKFLIKISGESISRPAFFAWLSNCLSASRLRGDEQLVFEIAEEDLVTHLNEIMQFSASLNLLSCGFAIEHFGSTKLTHQLLEKVSADYVKINGNRLVQLNTDPERKKEFKELIQFAQSKGKKVIVDSIEDPLLMAVLWEWGVRLFQGHYIEDPIQSLDFDFSAAVGNIFNS